MVGEKRSILSKALTQTFFFNTWETDGKYTKKGLVVLGSRKKKHFNLSWKIESGVFSIV